VLVGAVVQKKEDNNHGPRCLVEISHAVDAVYVFCQVWNRADVKREKKVVVLMELHRAIIYTTEMSKQVTMSHMRDAVHMYPVN
jgi:hypothetical protein